jgi:phosphatidylserine/phosphatidylglycerophosphate/cardiolipin synthase-like enzyme
MPRIFDNIALTLLPALNDTLQISERADFCVGYFNLRGWKQIDHLIDAWAGGDGSCCRVIVGMQKLPQDELLERFSLTSGPDTIDQQVALRLRRAAAQEFRSQLTIGAPTDEDEKGLRRLSAQLKARKVVVKLFLRHSLHAKLYLVHRTDPNNPSIGFVGSSNLTLAGLSKQGELNVDVLDHDACKKLQNWFEDQWNGRVRFPFTTEIYLSYKGRAHMKITRRRRHLRPCPSRARSVSRSIASAGTFSGSAGMAAGGRPRRP